jgi:hypothetical protein
MPHHNTALSAVSTGDFCTAHDATTNAASSVVGIARTALSITIWLGFKKTLQSLNDTKDVLPCTFMGADIPSITGWTYRTIE